MPRTKTPARRFAAGGEIPETQSSTVARRKNPDMEVELNEEDAASTIQPKLESKIPPWARFPLVLIMNLSLSSVMYGLSTRWTAGELASVSRHFEGWTVLAGLLGWRAAELALGWFGDYDSYDLVSLITLSRFPPLYLMTAFYNVAKPAAVTSLVIDALATYIPFRVLRPLSPAHRNFLNEGGKQVPNQIIISDPYIKAFTVILASSIYSTALYASFMTFLPATLVTYFTDIPSVEPTHTATPISLLPMNLVLGLSAYSFIFSPAAALPQGKLPRFNAATATFAETLWYNLWGWSPRTKVIIKRTAALMGVSGLNGWLQIWATIEGVESAGAAVYSSVWAAAGLITGVAYSLVCDV